MTVEIFNVDFAGIWIIKQGDQRDSGCFYANGTKAKHICRRKGNCLHLFSSSGHFTHMDGDMSWCLPFECNKIGSIASGEIPKFLSNNIMADPDIQNHDWIKKTGLPVFAGYQILSDGKLIGVLTIFSKHIISSGEDILLESISSLATQVIQRAMDEEALRNSEEKFRSLVENSPDLIIQIDRDGRILFINYTVPGIKGEDVLGKTIYEYIHSEYHDIVKKSVEKVFKTGESDSYEPLGVGQYGSMVNYRTHIGPIKKAGEVVAAILIARDITEHKNYEVQLKEMLKEVENSHKTCKSILNMLRLGAIILDREGKVKFVNETVENLSGKRLEALQGVNWKDLIILENQYKKQLKQALSSSNKKNNKFSANVSFKSGKDYWMDIEVRDGPENPENKTILLYDMSEIFSLRRLLEKNTQFHKIIGKSKIMHDIYQQIQSIARVDWTVLIEGETGTGKELVAQAIHFSSYRKNKPFIPVNCAGLADSLLNSQLFGHKRGAFTGAVIDQEGLFDAANGGTIFLDEIGDIPLNVQITLLRVLEEREITRIGESRPRKVNVRIIVATNSNLADEVKKGKFRKDLLYRIRVARIKIPPLRQRREDIPLLVKNFLYGAKTMIGKPVKEVSSEVMRYLLNYDWPGNVRELKSTVEFAFLSCNGTVIQLQDLPPEVFESHSTEQLKIPIAGDERTRILTALKQTKYNRKRAAGLLGLSRAAFYRHMKRLGINPDV